MRPSSTICSTLRRESTPALASTFWMRSFTASYLPEGGRVGYARHGAERTLPNLLVVGNVRIEDPVIDLPSAQGRAGVDRPAAGTRRVLTLLEPSHVAVLEEEIAARRDFPFHVTAVPGPGVGAAVDLQHVRGDRSGLVFLTGTLLVHPLVSIGEISGSVDHAGPGIGDLAIRQVEVAHQAPGERGIVTGLAVPILTGTEHDVVL